MENFTSYKSEVTTRPILDSYKNFTTIDQYQKSWPYKIRIYSLIICTIIGCPGNLVSFAVFLRSKLKCSSNGVYLMSLALVDTLVLVIEILVRTNVVALSDASCKVSYYFRYSFKLLEAFLVVSLTVDRTACLVFPITSYKCYNQRAAIWIIMFETTAAFLMCIYPWFTIILYGSQCHTNYKAYVEMVHMYADNIISVLIGEILTSLIVIVLAILIIRSLSQLPEIGQRNRNDRKHSTCRTLDKQVTRMTAAVAVTFTCLRLPYSLLYFISSIRHTIYKQPYYDQFQEVLTDMINIASVFAMLNYCTNFFIYLVCWKAFRTQCKNMLMCKKSEISCGNPSYNNSREKQFGENFCL